MSTYQEMMYCAACDKPTIHLRTKTSHILHLLLSLVTAGIWIIVWILMAQSNSLRSQCTACGRTRNWGQDAPSLPQPWRKPGAPPPAMDAAARKLGQAVGATLARHRAPKASKEKTLDEILADDALNN